MPKEIPRNARGIPPLQLGAGHNINATAGDWDIGLQNCILMWFFGCDSMGFMGYDGGFMAFLGFLMSYDFLDDFLYVIQWFFLWYDGVWCDTGVISHDMEGFLYGLMGFLCDTTFFNVIQCVFDALPRVFSPMWVCPEEIQAVDNQNLQHLHLCSLSLI